MFDVSDSSDAYVSEPQRAAVPLPPTSDIGETLPKPPSFVDLREAQAPELTRRPLVEPVETWLPRLEEMARTAEPQILDRGIVPWPLPRRVSHRQWQTPLQDDQDGRGTCWAFAGCAALEAAYARIGVAADLSPHYLFHISKAHENHASNSRTHSLRGFEGASDIIHHLTYWAVPSRTNVPYIDQAPLQAIANSIPGTGGALANAGTGTREQADWFEFDLRHIPLMGRWFAQHRVQTYGTLTSFTNLDICMILLQGYDVVVDVFDKVNNGGHVLLIHGYDDNAQTFDIKNSQAKATAFSTMQYTNDPQFQIQYGVAYYIISVEPVATQWPAMWVGRWESDHDGWRGSLIIRRFTDIRSNNLYPGPNSRISLGTWYGEDGRALDVVGHFVDGGRGLFCDIGGQPFELYLHTRDPYRAAGRCWWNNTPFGVVLSRGTATGAGSGFTRSESIGIWDTVHDGWRGELRIGVQPRYVQAADGVVRGAWIEPGATPHRVDTHVDFGGDNRDQCFELLVHTQEDGVLGGLTGWGGRDWPVEGRMAQNLYTIGDDGLLRWHRHVGRPTFTFEWDPERTVGHGWNSFHSVFGGGDGVFYAIQHDGVLRWYFHDGRNQGTMDWQGYREVGSGWTGFTRVFAGDGGVIYGLQPDGKLQWYRHLGRRDGSWRWQGPYEVGTNWDQFTALTAGPDGSIYGILPDGRLLWYRHYGHDQGYPIWHGAIQVGTGWQGIDRIWAVGNGYLYGREAAGAGDLWLWRHHGFLTGEWSWTDGVKVGYGWGGLEVIAT